MVLVNVWPRKEPRVYSNNATTADDRGSCIRLKSRKRPLLDVGMCATCRINVYVCMFWTLEHIPLGRRQGRSSVNCWFGARFASLEAEPRTERDQDRFAGRRRERPPSNNSCGALRLVAQESWIENETSDYKVKAKLYIFLNDLCNFDTGLYCD